MATKFTIKNVYAPDAAAIAKAVNIVLDYQDAQKKAQAEPSRALAPSAIPPLVKETK